MYQPADLGRAKATVFLFTSSQCPVANAYTQRIIALGRDYETKSVRFFLVHESGENAATLLRYVRERGFPMPSVRDDGALRLADQLDASTTPEAVVLDNQARVRYRGRIDNSRDPDKVFRRDVRDALDAVLAGRPVARPRMLAFGCTIFREAPKVVVATKTAQYASPVTYAGQVAAILDKNCVSCHRAGEAAPFALDSYRQARVWARAIKDYTVRRAMPPWKAVRGHGEFLDARVLPDRDIAMLARWADAGAPEGNPKRRPPLPRFAPAGQWVLGTPDQIVRPARPYHLGADGKDVYRQYVLPLDFARDEYLSAIEFKPGNRAVVHHMIAYLDPSGASAKLDGREREPGYTVPGTGVGIPNAKFVWGWAPGNTPRALPPGTAYRLTKGAKLILQVHYHKSGKPETDQSSLGLFYAKTPVDREMRVWDVSNSDFVLLPGRANQHVRAMFVLPEDVHVWSLLPHMHMLGRQMHLTAQLPDGSARSLIYIADWDFNWQESYNYKQPLALPKGTKILLDAVFDNSERNPRQPLLPPREVRFGEQTIDEMCIGFFTVTVDRERLNIVPGRTKTVQRGLPSVL